MVDSEDIHWLRRAVALAQKVLKAGDEVLISAEVGILKEARNRVGSGDATQHPELTLSRWAAENLTPSVRAFNQ